jgi:hypothetical protein
MIIANMTLPPPYDYMLRVNGISGNSSLNLVPIQVIGLKNSSALVVSVHQYSVKRGNIYAEGDVLDIIITFTRPVVVRGVPSMLLQGLSTGTPMSLSYAEVARVQYIEVSEGGMFSVGYLTQNTQCLYANDTNGLNVQLESLYVLSASYPLIITATTDPTAKTIIIKLEFSGVSPFLLSPINCKTGPLGRPVTVSVDDEMKTQVVFRRNITRGDHADILTYMNTSILVYGGGSYLSEWGKAANVILPTPLGPNGLAVTGIRVSTTPAYVLSISSPFNTTGVDGDIVDVFVNMSAPVVVISKLGESMNVYM